LYKLHGRQNLDPPLTRNVISSDCSKKKFSFHLAVNILRPYYQAVVTQYIEKIAAYCENHRKHTYSVRGQNAEFVTHQAGAV
jgi:hypothetical protein